METLRFKLKDRVIGKVGVPRIGGKVGTVVEVEAELRSHDYGVQFDEIVENGHDFGSDLYKNGHCRWVNDSELEPYIEAASEPYFAGARVGDSVYDMAYGDGIIVGGDHANITVQFKDVKVFYTAAGVRCSYHYLFQTLFYSKPVFNLPPPPKRKVKKVVEGWMNIYCHAGDFEGGVLFKTETIADENQSPGRIGKAVPIQHEYDE